GVPPKDPPIVGVAAEIGPNRSNTVSICPCEARPNGCTVALVEKRWRRPASTVVGRAREKDMRLLCWRLRERHPALVHPNGVHGVRSITSNEDLRGVVRRWTVSRIDPGCGRATDGNAA